MRLTTSPPLCAECHEIWEPKPRVRFWATPGLLRDSFTFFKSIENNFTMKIMGLGKRKQRRSPYLISADVFSSCPSEGYEGIWVTVSGYLVLLILILDTTRG